MRDRSNFRCLANLPCGKYSNPLRHFSKRLSDIYARICGSACPVYPLCGESTMWRIYHVANLPCGESPMWQILWQPTGLGLIGMVVFLDCALCNFFVHLLCRCALAPDQYFLTVLSAVCKLFVRLLCCCALALNQSK